MTFNMDTVLGTLWWFGRPWPTSENPAPICAPGNRTVVPLHEPCHACNGPFEPMDRGIIVPHVVWDGVSRRAYHLHCFHRLLGAFPTPRQPRD